MKQLVTICAYLVALLLCEEVQAQPFLFADTSPTSVALGGGAAFGQGRVLPGFSLDVRHGFALNTRTPDMGAYATLVTRLAPTWLLLNNLGAGATITATHDIRWSARGLFILTNLAPVALRASLFVAWTPETDGVVASLRVGPNFKLHNTILRLYPNLALAITSTNASPTTNVSITPGLTLFANF
ncbi:MAG: hypothetical protein WCV84_04330 [Patescibacteria group bacterium]